MKLQDYIESGILELYVLELLDAAESAEVKRMLFLHPELKQETERISFALERYAMKTAIEPSAGLGERIIQAVYDSTNIDLNDLGLINENSDYQNWLHFVKQQFPDALTAENFCAVVAEREDVKQILVVSTFDIEEETHEDVYESFLILQGKCRCTVGGKIFYLEAGGYTRISLEEEHQVEVIDGPVMAIVQYESL